MEIVTISPQFQVVIPRRIRERLQLSPGQRVQVIAYGERIELIPVRPVEAMRGFLRGIDARGAPGWRLADETPYWIVLPLVALWGLLALWTLHRTPLPSAARA